MAKAAVNKKTCIGCGLCAQLCPNVFELDGDKAKVKVKAVAGADEACAKNAVTQCPSKSITVK